MTDWQKTVNSHSTITVPPGRNLSPTVFAKFLRWAEKRKRFGHTLNLQIPTSWTDEQIEHFFDTYDEEFSQNQVKDKEESVPMGKELYTEVPFPKTWTQADIDQFLKDFSEKNSPAAIELERTQHKQKIDELESLLTSVSQTRNATNKRFLFFCLLIVAGAILGKGLFVDSYIQIFLGLGIYLGLYIMHSK